MDSLHRCSILFLLALEDTQFRCIWVPPGSSSRALEVLRHKTESSHPTCPSHSQRSQLTHGFMMMDHLFKLTWAEYVLVAYVSVSFIRGARFSTIHFFLENVLPSYFGAVSTSFCAVAPICPRPGTVHCIKGL